VIRAGGKIGLPQGYDICHLPCVFKSPKAEGMKIR